MTPFPGESLGLSYTDGVNFDSVWLRGGRGGEPPSATITTGDEWRAWVDPGTQNYLEDPGTPVVASWVVETVGGSGTLQAAWGFDPMFGDPSAPAPNDLGSQSVTGTQTVVFTTTLTAADIMDGDYPVMLLLTCPTGSVDVQQIKLRVWPPEGVAGGWVDMPAWDTEPNAVATAGAFVGRGTATYDGEREAAWNAAAADSASGGAVGAAGPHPVSALGLTVASDVIAGVTRQTVFPDVPPVINMSTSFSGINASVDFNPHGALVRLSGVNADDYSAVAPDKVEGVDWIIPPTEVPGEVDAYLFQWDGERDRVWINSAATVVVGGEAPGDTLGVGSFMVGVTMAQWTTTTDPITGIGTDRWFNEDMVDIGALAPSGMSDTVTEIPIGAGDDYTVLAFSHAMASTVISWPGYPPFTGSAGTRSQNWVAHLGVGDPYSSGFQPMATVVHMPPYRVWSPTVVRRAPHLIFDRSDDLGAGAAFVYGRDTRQSSGLVYGNY